MAAETQTIDHSAAGATAAELRTHSDPEEAVANLRWHFDDVALHDDTAYRISHAFLALESAAGKLAGTTRLTTLQRTDLLLGLHKAFGKGLRVLIEDIHPRDLQDGFDAAAEIIARWAEDKDARQSRHAHFELDQHAKLRILRNRLHNVSLAIEIAERAAQRRASAVSQLVVD